MAMNSLRKLVECLETGSGEIHVDPELGKRARLPIQRLLDFAKENNQQVLLSGDA
jgi:quinolinate synthase